MNKNIMNMAEDAHLRKIHIAVAFLNQAKTEAKLAEAVIKLSPCAPNILRVKAYRCYCYRKAMESLYKKQAWEAVTPELRRNYAAQKRAYATAKIMAELTP